MNRCPRVLIILAVTLCIPAATVLAAEDPLQQTARRLDAQLTRHAEAGDLNGAVLIARGPKVLVARAFGMAHTEWEVANTVQTRFDVFSMTKAFTSILVLQLVQEGKISLDAPITDYLPHYRNDTGDKITVEHLLTHSHGIPDVDSRTLPLELDLTVREFIATYASGDLRFEPGSQVEYSALIGYTLLGAIIEQVTGKTYEEVLQARIVRPLGLDDTGFIRSRAVIPRFATSYLDTIHERRRHFFRFRCNGASSVYSTVEDLHRWYLAAVGGKLLAPEMTAAMLQPRMPADAPVQAYGWIAGSMLLGGKERRIVAISGGGRNVLCGVPADGACVVLLNNVRCPKAGEIAMELLSAIYDEP